jgi:hypothetical protein
MAEGEGGIGVAARPAPADWRSSPLWRSLAAMRIEPKGAALSFSARLARENGWSATHTGAVMGEYRRFLYLAAHSEAVTPSEDVDQAWHLHLTYSRHYWETLCASLLGRPLHHEPTTGGTGERAHYRRQYEATLALYRATFGDAPPPSVWPAGVERFAVRPLRIDAARYWLVPKAAAGMAGALGAAALLAACTALAANSSADGTDRIGAILLGALLLIVAAVVTLTYLRRPGQRDDKGCSAGSCGSGCGAGSGHDNGSSGCGGGGGGGGGCGGGCGS